VNETGESEDEVKAGVCHMHCGRDFLKFWAHAEKLQVVATVYRRTVKTTEYHKYRSKSQMTFRLPC